MVVCPLFPTVVHLLAAAAARWPEREAIVADGRRVTYRGYLSCVAGFARELSAVRGERVASILPNGAEICIATFAAHGRARRWCRSIHSTPSAS